MQARFEEWALFRALIENDHMNINRVETTSHLWILKFQFGNFFLCRLANMQLLHFTLDQE